jgi:hypothetical protein
MNPKELVHYSALASHLALVFMGIVYAVRIKWLLGFKAGRERQAPTGTGSAQPWRSILYSWANIATPWGMESTRTQPFLYAQFVIFHLGVATAIGLTFLIPFAPGLLAVPAVGDACRVITGAASLVGVMRIVRRVGGKYMRAISTPDDYFSLILLTVWLFFAALSSTNDTSGGVWHLVTFFVMTVFFLVYVPFSKISHYLYYPFTRYYFGKTMGRRGVYPIVHQNEPVEYRSTRIEGIKSTLSELG